MSTQPIKQSYLERISAERDKSGDPPSDAKTGDVWGAYRLESGGWWVLNTPTETSPINVTPVTEADLRASLAAIHYNACRPPIECQISRAAHLLTIVEECERCIPALKGLRP